METSVLDGYGSTQGIKSTEAVRGYGDKLSFLKLLPLGIAE